MIIPSATTVAVSNLRHVIVQLQTCLGEAELSMPEVAETVVDGMEVMITMIIVVVAREVQPGLQPGTSITFRPPGMA